MPTSPSPSNQEIAVVTTGGTIGSVLSDSVRAVGTASGTIAERISNHCDDLGVELEIAPAMNMLSENMEPTDWADVGAHILECVEDGYENVVVTHGTDTMVYSANAFRNAVGDLPARVVFTGSFYGPDEPDSDVEIALRSSLEASIEPSLDHDVYVDFRSPETDEEALLHRAVDTRAMNMDDTGFRSLFGSEVGQYTWDDGWTWFDSDSPTHDVDRSGLGGVPEREEFAEVLGDVRLVPAVPGQIMPTFDDELPEAVIVSLYHSGTASDSTHSGSLRNFIQEYHDQTEILLTGMSSEVVSPPYESTAKLVEEGARLIQDVQPSVVYTGLYVGLANGLDVDEVLSRTPGRELQIDD